MQKLSSSRGPRDRVYLLALGLCFVASRVVFRAVGVRFSTDQLSIAIQYLDPELLRHHLLESVWYLHTQPPLYNLLLGVMLKLFPGHYGLAFHALQLALRLVGMLALYLLLVGFAVPRLLSAGLALAFAVSPAAILYENRLFYDYPVLVLLLVAALAAQRLAARPSASRTALLLSLLAVVVLVRSVYQLVWLLLVLALLLAFSVLPARVLLAAAAVPILAVAGLLVKNGIVFGSPSTSSWLPTNLAKVGIYTIPYHERRELVRRGELDPVELVKPYAKLAAYRGIVRRAARRGIPALDRPLKANGKVNLDNATYLKISRRQLHDDVHFIPSHPGWYVRGVKLAFERFFWPPTYPAEITGDNKYRIRRWESLWEAGAYGSTPYANRIGFVSVLAYLAAVAYGLAVLVRRRDRDAPALGFIWLTIVYTAAIGVLTDLGENYRSRFAVDPLVLVLLAVAAHRGWLAIRERSAHTGRRDPLRDAEALV